MIEPLNQTAKVLRDTTLSHSTGSAFRTVTAMYGLPFTDEVPESDWREAAKVMAFGPRGTPGTTLAFLERMTASWGVDIEVAYIDTAPSRLFAVLPDVFLPEHVGRYVRMADTGRLHYISNLFGVVNVDLSPVDTAQWSGANWTNSAFNFTTATILPFTIAERGGGPGQSQAHFATIPTGKLPQVEITMYVNGLGPPPTYMQPGATTPPAPASVPGDAAYNSGSMDPVPNASPLIGAEARTGGQPYGGHVQADESEPGDIGGAGPFPIYLAGAGVLPRSRRVFKAMLASGIEAAFIDGYKP